MERENSLGMNYIGVKLGNPKHKIQFSDNFLILQYCCFIVSAPIILCSIVDIILYDLFTCQLISRAAFFSECFSIVYFSLKSKDFPVV